MPRQEKRIVVEGMDGTGKSTLIAALMDRFHFLELIHNELGPKQDFNKWWPEQLEREESEIIPIHDRFFYSELVYGAVLRGKINAETGLVTNVQWFLRMSSMLIYCRPPLSDVEKGFKTNPQMDGVAEKLQELIDTYDQIMTVEMDWYGLRFIHYNYRGHSLQEVESRVEQYLLSSS